MSEVEADEPFDVLVVGYGGAGVCAAIEAAEAGARVLALDRDYGGGATALSGGIVYAGGGTPYQQAAGVDDSPEDMFDYLKLEVGNAVSDDLLRRFCAGSTEQLAWLTARGVPFGSSLCKHKTSYPPASHDLYYSGNESVPLYARQARPAARGHRVVAPGAQAGRALYQRLFEAAAGAGVDFRPLSRVDALLMDRGHVVGAEYRTMAGGGLRHRVAMHHASRALNWFPRVGEHLVACGERLWRASAVRRRVRAKSVILAAGGFAFNRDMVRVHAPAYLRARPIGCAGDDGSGIRLGQSAGGAVAHMERLTAWRLLAPPVAFLESVAVGRDGRRIGNEELYGATFSEAMVHDHGGRGYAVMDASTWSRVVRQHWRQAQLLQRLQLWYVLTVGHKRARTVEALAAKLGISAQGLRTTLDDYNRRATEGAPDPAGKSASLRRPLVEEPFYGVDISLGAATLYPVPSLTLGGLTVDERSGAVLTRTGAPIPGLYAAGRTAAGLCSSGYVSGLSLADCVFSGRRAGAAAADAGGREVAVVRGPGRSVTRTGTPPAGTHSTPLLRRRAM